MLRTITVLSSICRAQFGRPFSRSVMSQSRHSTVAGLAVRRDMALSITCGHPCLLPQPPPPPIRCARYRVHNQNQVHYGLSSTAIPLSLSEYMCMIHLSLYIISDYMCFRCRQHGVGRTWGQANLTGYYMDFAFWALSRSAQYPQNDMI